MKKTFLLLGLALCSIVLMAQNMFTGTTIMRQTMHYENNFDVIVENVKAFIDKDTTMDAGTKGMAKMMAKTIAKNQMKMMEIQKYITALPEGEFTTYEKWDGVNNRAMIFTPELGRVVVWDGNEGTLIVAYMNLKTALKVTDPSYKTNQFRMSCAYIAPAADEEVTEINGFRAIPNYGLAELAKVGGDKSEAINIDGKDYVKVPAPGYKLEYYGILVQQTSTTEYYTMEQTLTDCKQGPVDAANFSLPNDYKVVNKADALVKSLKKAIKNNGLAVNYDVKQMPEVIWSIQ